MATITTEKFGDLAFDSGSFLYDYNSQGDKVAGQFKVGGQEYTFIPQNIAEKGIISGDRQRYLGNLLVDDNLKALGTEGVYVDLAGVNNYDTAFEKKGWSTTGFLVPAKVASDRKLVGSVRSYEIGKDLGRGMQMGAIQGASEIGGKPVYVTDPMGKAQSTWIQPPGTSGYDGQNVTGTSQGRYTYTRNNFGFIGEIASGIGRAVGGVPFLPELIGFATGQPLLAAGLRGAASGAAGMDPLKAGLLSGVSAAGVQAGLNVQAGVDPITGAAPSSVGGTPGVSQVYQVAPPGGTSAPLPPQAAGSSLAAGAPIVNATPVPAGELAFPAREVAANYTPVPGSFQAALPGLGVETAASAAPYTAAAGSFAAALPSLLNPAASSGLLSVSDALRGANLANQLMGGGQQTATGFPQQQSSFQPTGVDYSGIYGLLGQRPSVLGISSLLGPAQIRFPSLLG
jgi:hypothetical protein